MSKSHGKGLGFGLHEQQSQTRTQRAEWTEGVPRPEFKPLRSYPATAHPRQSEIDAFCRAPSRFA